MMNSYPDEIRAVCLELLRAGPAHNQLLSPLTHYVALCGADGPVTLNLPFEHRHLLMRLKRLRYLQEPPGADEQRQAELLHLGEEIGRIFAKIPALIAELGNISTDRGTLIHLRLSMSAFELGLLPFEAAIAAEGFPGAGSPLFLQMRTPLTITREIRRGRPLTVNWDQPPRILFAFAAPAGSYVPAQAHLQALRQAIEPWVNIKSNPAERLSEVKKMLTVLPQATLQQIRDLCQQYQFTHVHLLAHGDHFSHSGDTQYGVALCDAEHADQADIVDGERLAIALTSHDPAGTTPYRPTLVTLATCDSGTVSSVMTPGGSIAHQLHASGIPWVIASQFPLWMKASSIAAHLLYSGLLQGEDPRWVLHQLRHRLRTDAPETHDWASIVAYATLPSDFNQQIDAFRVRQTKRKIDVKFDRIDELMTSATTKPMSELVRQELQTLCAAIRMDLKNWLAEASPTAQLTERALKLGLNAVCEKRIGLMYELLDESVQAEQAYAQCERFYHQAWKADLSNHWLMTQYLSIMAIRKRQQPTLAFSRLSEKYGNTWCAAIEIVNWQLETLEGENKIYALLTKIELLLLQSVYHFSMTDPQLQQQEIQLLCAQIRQHPPTSDFAILSGKRQFTRYLTHWACPIWQENAEKILDALPVTEP